MFEYSVDNFVNDWRSFAATVVLYPSIEGSPLLEVGLSNSEVLYLLDRTGPYVEKPGPTEVIINPTTYKLEPANSAEEIFSTQISQIQVKGSILQIKPHFVVVKSIIPLVVSVFDNSWRNFQVGDFVSFESLAPIHGFVIKTKPK